MGGEGTPAHFSPIWQSQCDPLHELLPQVLYLPPSRQGAAKVTFI